MSWFLAVIINLFFFAWAAGFVGYGIMMLFSRTYKSNFSARIGGVVFIAIGLIGAWMTKFLFDRFPANNRTNMILLTLGIFAFVGLVIGSIYIKGDVMIGGLFEKRSDKFRKVFGIVLIVIALIFASISIIGGISENKGNDNSKTTCGVCHRTFKEGSDNARSIARSNMCENCHDNFEWRQEVQDYIDNQPVD